MSIVAVTAPRFAGHETFTLRYGWLKKVVDATREQQDILRVKLSKRNA